MDEIALPIVIFQIKKTIRTDKNDKTKDIEIFINKFNCLNIFNRPQHDEILVSPSNHFRTVKFAVIQA